MRGKNFGIHCQWRSELLWIVIFHFLLVKAAMNAVRDGAITVKGSLSMRAGRIF
jgi:hypothetical protein